MFRSLIIGCGKIAGIYDRSRQGFVYSHAHAYDRSRTIELTCCVDHSMEKARKLARQYGSPHYEDDFLASVKRCRPDVVSLCTPDDTHFEILKTLLEPEAGVRLIFAEKPVCSTREQLEYLISKSKERRIPIVVNHSRRFEARHQYLKQFIHGGNAGCLVRGDIFYYGGWLHNGVHIVDTLGYLFRDALEISSVTGGVETQYPGDPTLHVVLRLKRTGSKIYLNAFDESHYQLFDIDLKFERGRLRIEDFGNRFFWEEKKLNEMKENILVEGRLNFPVESLSPMEKAVNIIGEYLTSGDHDLLTGYTINDIVDTMVTVWEGEKKYSAQIQR